MAAVLVASFAVEPEAASARVGAGAPEQLDKTEYKLAVDRCDSLRASGTITNRTGGPASFKIEVYFKYGEDDRAGNPFQSVTTDLIDDGESAEFSLGPDPTAGSPSGCDVREVTLAERGKPGEDARGNPVVTAKVRRQFAKAPAVVVTRAGPAAPPGPSAAELPSWYLDNPLAKRARWGLDQADDDVIATYPSPDGRYLALNHEPTPTKPGRYEVVNLEDGDVVSTVEYGSEVRVNPEFIWSPDGRSFAFHDEANYYFHRVGGATTEFPSLVGGRSPELRALGFSSDESASALVFCGGVYDASTDEGFPAVIIATVGDTPGDVETQRYPDVLGPTCQTLQSADSAGEPLALVAYAAAADELFVRVDSSGDLVPLLRPPGVSALGATVCNGFAVVRSDDGVAGWVYSPTKDAFFSIPDPFFGELCPIPSPDGTKFALVPSSDGSVIVGDFTTDEITVISRVGRPMAWSADGDEVLVQGNGTFIVAVDGSGADEASEQLATQSGADDDGAFCRAGNSGAAILDTQDGLVLFDIGEDSGVPLPTSANRALWPTCTVSPDGHWLLAGRLLVDLERMRGMELPTFDGTTGRSNPDPRDFPTLIEAHLWYGPQYVTITQSRTRVAT